MSVNSKMTAIANAIRSRSGGSEKLTLDEMAVAIQGLGRSQIIVIAPTGSTVTATMGGVIKTAVEKAGIWTFKNCDLGVWTITATRSDQAKPATGTVEIKEAGQLMRYYITVSYFTAAIEVTFKPGYQAVCTHEDGTVLESDESGSYTFALNKGGIWTITSTFSPLISETVNAVDGGSYTVDASRAYLYKLGDERVDITGGWEKQTAVKVATVSPVSGSVTKNADCITITSQNSTATAIGTAKKIDVTAFSSMHINITSCSGATPHSIMVLMSEYKGDINYDSVGKTSSQGSGETQLDMSKLTGEYYAAVCNSGARSATFNEIWLE